jgi:hypothetical protein
MRGFQVYQAALMPTDMTVKRLRVLHDQGATLHSSITDVTTDFTPGLAKDVNAWRSEVSHELARYSTHLNRFNMAGRGHNRQTLRFTTDAELRVEMTDSLRVLAKIVDDLSERTEEP